MPGLVRLVAPNPSALTERGTNSYLLGSGALAVIDPGPDLPAHLDALLGAIAGRPVSHILVTHAHRDHSALAPRLAALTGAPVLAFGDALAGRNPRAALPGLDEGEGVDLAFRPDVTLADGATIAGDGWHLTALHTPGHMGNHLCLAWGDALFSGDTAMGWATSVVSPPEGCMTAYMTSLARLLALAPQTLLPGHGALVADAPRRLTDLLAHRRMREAQVLAALARGPAPAGALARAIYSDLAPALLPAATRNVLAHLLDLQDRKLVTTDPAPGLRATFALAQTNPLNPSGRPPAPLL